jgi:RNA polymerase sigma-70 factor (ECF subfamily)
MSENALRQLIFRARASFKKALVGEAEIQGKSMSQVLSIAARKAAAESGKYISAAGAFLLVLAISIGILPNLGQAPVSEVAEAPITQESNSATEGSANSQSDDNGSASTNSNSDSTGSTNQSEGSETQEATSSDNSGESEAASESNSQPLAESVLAEAPASVIVAQPALVLNPEPTPEVTQLPTLDESDFDQILATDVSQAGFYTSSKAASFADFFQGESIEIFGGTGISAFVYVNPTTLQIENAMFQMWVDGERYYAIARVSSVSNLGLNLGYRGSNFYVVDDQGRVFDNSPLANANVKVDLVVDSQGKPVRASLRVSR